MHCHRNSASTTTVGRPMTFAKMLEETYTDGIAVLHRGRLIYERYFGALKSHKPHIGMLVTKSFTGVLAGMLVAEGTFLGAPFRSVCTIMYHDGIWRRTERRKPC